jgi:hypothetical protein
MLALVGLASLILVVPVRILIAGFHGFFERAFWRALAAAVSICAALIVVCFAPSAHAQAFTPTQTADGGYLVSYCGEPSAGGEGGCDVSSTPADSKTLTNAAFLYTYPDSTCDTYPQGWFPAYLATSGEYFWVATADGSGTTGCLPIASVTFGAGSAGSSGSGGSSAFDPSMLDPATITAYFSTGWFIVAMGWLIGKGVSLLVQFIKQI